MNNFAARDRDVDMKQTIQIQLPLEGFSRKTAVHHTPLLSRAALLLLETHPSSTKVIFVTAYAAMMRSRCNEAERPPPSGFVVALPRPRHA